MNRLEHWIEQRTGLSQLTDWLGKKGVPQHRHTLWYYCGGAILMLIGAQTITGFLLLLYYKPTTQAAYSSVVRIMNEVPLGWIFRSIHRWTSHLLIVVVFLHLFSTLFLRAYRRPREITWVTGCLLLIVMLAFGFTGYLLPWDELSLAATKVGTDIVREIPLIGSWLSTILRGGEDVTEDTLTRFFSFHVCYLPAMMVGLAVIHVFLVQRHGMSLPATTETTPPTQIPFYPNFLYRELVLWLFLLGGLVTLSSLLPTHLGHEADLMAPAPKGVKPEWYFLFLFQVFRIFPSRISFLPGDTVAVTLTAVAALALCCLPAFDREFNRRRNRWITWGAGIFVGGAVLFSIWGYIS